MEFMGIGLLELFLILFICLVIFGPEKMIEISRMLGRYVHQFKAITTEVTRQINEEMDKETSEIKADIQESVKEISRDLTEVPQPPFETKGAIAPVAQAGMTSEQAVER